MDHEIGAKRHGDAEGFLELVARHRDVVVPLANGEPDALMRAVDGSGARLRDVRIHQMHALRDRAAIRGELPGVRHVAYFLSPVTRRAYAAGTVDFTPAHFSDLPEVLRHIAPDPIVAAAASPPDRHGWFSLGTNADYVASFIGRAPFFLAVNPQMPRTRGENNVHISQVAGWVFDDHPLIEVPRAEVSDRDRTIGRLIAARIPDGATVQVGIGSIPSAVLDELDDHRDLGVHTELLSDALADLFESGVITGTRKATRPGKMVTTFALGTHRTYDFVADNAAVEFLPVDWVNNPRVIGLERDFVSVNATCEVDLHGQANSEMIEGRLWSGSGGQADFAHGAMFSERGQGFLALHSTTSDESVSRIKVRLDAGAQITTLKNAVDNVVTEYGIAELRGQPISVRARRLIDVAHPRFRDGLEAEARTAGILRG